MHPPMKYGAATAEQRACRRKGYQEWRNKRERRSERKMKKREKAQKERRESDVDFELAARRKKV